MMEDIAMQILELMMNSIAAEAKYIQLLINDSVTQNKISIKVIDDGKGMSEEYVKIVDNPFTSSRKTRKIGMGVSFMKGLCEMCNGSFNISSKLGEGTTIECIVQKDHIDLPPMGNLGEMVMACIQANENTRYLMEYKTDVSKFVFDSNEIKKELDGVSLVEPEILLWIKEYVNQGIMQVKEGMI